MDASRPLDHVVIIPPVPGEPFIAILDTRDADFAPDGRFPLRGAVLERNAIQLQRADGDIDLLNLESSPHLQILMEQVAGDGLMVMSFPVGELQSLRGTALPEPTDIAFVQQGAALQQIHREAARS